MDIAIARNLVTVIAARPSIRRRRWRD